MTTNCSFIRRKSKLQQEQQTKNVKFNLKSERATLRKKARDCGGGNGSNGEGEKRCKGRGEVKMREGDMGNEQE